MSSVLRYPVQLSAGVDFPLICDGTIVYFENGADAITVNTGKDSAVLQPGQGFRASENFTRLRINSATAQSASIYISDTDIIDNRLVFASSSIEASIGNDTKNPLVPTYIGGELSIEGVAQAIVYVVFHNDTGEDLYITSAKIETQEHSVSPAGGQNWQLRVADYVSGGTSTNEQLRNKFDPMNDAAAIGDFYSNLPTIGSFKTLAIGNVGDAGNVDLFSSAEPLRLPDGHILYIFQTDGGRTSMILEAKPSAAAQNASGDGLEYIELGYTDASISGGILYGNTLQSLRDVLGVMQSASAADLANPASSINTDKKYLGKQVINSDTGAIVVAQGSAANATWINAV